MDLNGTELVQQAGTGKRRTKLLIESRDGKIVRRCGFLNNVTYQSYNKRVTSTEIQKISKKLIGISIANSIFLWHKYFTL